MKTFIKPTLKLALICWTMMIIGSFATLFVIDIVPEQYEQFCFVVSVLFWSVASYVITGKLLGWVAGKKS